MVSYDSRISYSITWQSPPFSFDLDSAFEASAPCSCERERGFRLNCGIQFQRMLGGFGQFIGKIADRFYGSLVIHD